MTLASLFFDTKGPSVSLTAKDLAVLDGLRELGPVGACCADLQRKLAQDCGQTPRLATLYALILRLEQKGLIEHIDMAASENGGRRSRLYQITKAGSRALDLGETIVAHLNSDRAAQPA